MRKTWKHTHILEPMCVLISVAAVAIMHVQATSTVHALRLQNVDYVMASITQQYITLHDSNPAQIYTLMAFGIVIGKIVCVSFFFFTSSAQPHSVSCMPLLEEVPLKNSHCAACTGGRRFFSGIVHGRGRFLSLNNLRPLQRQSLKPRKCSLFVAVLE